MLIKCTQRIAYCALVIALPAAVHAADAPKGERYALLVGVRQYSEAKELRPLPYAENDVTELAQVLRDGGYQPDNVVLMTQAAGAGQLRYLPLKARVLKELDLLLKNRGEDDTVLLAFAGHCVVLKEDPDSYFCPADAQLDDKDTLLSLTEVYRELEKCKAGTKVLLVDACRNDPLADRSRAPAKLDLDSVTRPPAPARDGGVAAFFSCSRGQKAYEDDRTKHGAFFRFIIDGLRGEAAPDSDDVSLLELGAFVQRRVGDFARAEYGADQKPEMSGEAQGSAPLVHSLRCLKPYRRGIALLSQAENRDAEYKDAEAEFTESIRLNPSFAPALAGRALARCEQKDLERAIADADEALRLDPKCAAAFTARATAWYAKRAYDKSLADAEAAIRLDAKSARALVTRGSSNYHRGDWDKAMPDYDEAIRIAPDSSLAWYCRGHLWSEKGESDKAIHDYDEAIRLNPKYVWAYVMRAAERLYADTDKAMADYDKAIELDPKSAIAYAARSEGWRVKGELDKGIADCDEAIRLDPKWALAYFHRSQLYKAKGDDDKAKADMDKYLQLAQ